MRDDIKETVANIIELYGTNPLKIAEELNIIVNFISLGTTIGFAQYSRRQTFININCDASESEQEFGLCHELGHVVLHNAKNTPFLKFGVPLHSVPKKEREANEFAICFLLRRAELDYDVSFNSEIAITYEQLGIPCEFEVYI